MQNLPTKSLRILAAAALAVMAPVLARADFNPIPLTPGSFNADVVVEKNAGQCIQNFVNVTMDNGTNDNANTWYEAGYGPTDTTAASTAIGRAYANGSSAAATGFPKHGSVIAATGDPNNPRQYLMPPDYSTNNCVFVGGANAPGGSFVVQVQSGTLTLATPTACTFLSVLYAGGGGNTINYTVHHATAGTETGTFTTTDWFSANSSDWTAGGRMNMDDGTLNTLYSTTQTKLFHNDIQLNNTTDPVTSIDFSYSGGSARSFFFAVSTSNDGNAFTPVAVSGFNRDVVVEATAPHVGNIFSATTVTMDNGTRNNGNTFYEMGFDRQSGQTPTQPGQTLTGIPVHGSTFTNTAGNHVFKMPPTYVGNDCFFVGNYAGVTACTMTFSTPAAYNSLSFLSSAGNGPVTNNLTIHHQDGSTESAQVVVIDWFNAASGGTSGTNSYTQAWIASGRFQTDNGNINNLNITSGTKLWANDLPLANTTSPVTSIDFAWGGGGRGPTFAVSGANGSTVPPWQPIDVTGYNADVVVENALTFPVGNMNAYITASMDGGTNHNGNTWFEQGWYTNMPTIGLPPAGSTIASIALPDHHYVMPATYVGPNAIYADSQNPTANITFANPSAYSALSFLSANANGSINIEAHIAHQDGVIETNFFVSKDWFNNSPYAFVSNGRVNGDRATVNSDPGRAAPPSNPRLYEAQFFLSDFNSPVTGASFTWTTNNGAGGASSATSRFVIMAVSGTTGAVAPILQSQPGNVIALEGSNVTFTVQVTGTPSLTNQWQISTDNGTSWNNLSDGGQFVGSYKEISTASAVTLTINSVTIANSRTQYRLVASNTSGSQTSNPASLTVYSGYPRVVNSTDTVAPYQPNGGSSPANATVAGAVDGLVGNDPAQYLNYGPGNANSTSFSGPVGVLATPARGATVLKALRFFTSTNTVAHDPADYTIEGSNDGGNNWTTISTGALALPAARNTQSPSVAENPLTQNLQEIEFYDNTTAYLQYRLSFSTVVTPSGTGNNSMEIGEIDFLGTTNGGPALPPALVRQPATQVTTYVGGSPTFGLAAVGTPTLTYQWYNGANAIPNATNATYTLANAQLSDSGSSFTCVVANGGGTVTSSASVLTVIAAPSTPYASAVLADKPMAYWQLNEGPNDGSGNNGVVAYDYSGGHNGVYTNTELQDPGFDFAQDGGTAGRFGLISTADSYVSQIQDISFAAPASASSNVAFSVEAWVLLDPNFNNLSDDAGIVTKGYGGGGEQFNLDCGSTDPSHLFRFFVRDTAGATHAVSGSVGPTNAVGPFTDGIHSWHHVVAVCDYPHSNILLYIDGRLNNSAPQVLTNGILASSVPVSIGSRSGGNGQASYTNQFFGTIDDVAIYGAALSSNQVVAHYNAAHPNPVFTLTPTNVTVPQDSTVTLVSSAYGPAPQTYQWYQSSDGGGTFQAMSGKTAATVSFTAAASLDGHMYEVAAMNPYGGVTSAPVSLSIIQGPPQILADLPSFAMVYAGQTATLSALVGGTSPFTYQWMSNNVAMTDSGRITGTHTATLTIAAAQTSDGATYRLHISNNQGTADSTACQLLVESTPNFATNGVGWVVNGTGYTPTFANNALTITTAANNEATAVWYPYPLYIGNFIASFTYRNLSSGGADGATFCLQNDPRGTAALGGGGGALAVSGVTPSAEIEFNVYAPNTPGIAYHINGANGGYVAPTPVAIDTGDPINVTVRYNGSVARLVMTDPSLNQTFSTDLAVGDLTAVLGGTTAYVGFTGATGGSNAQQQFSNFYFLPLPALNAVHNADGSITLSWPASIGGYALQSATSLAPANWAADNSAVTTVGGNYQVTVSAGSAQKLYRLSMSTPAPH